MGSKKPVDPLEGPRFALSGQLVTMDQSFRVVQRGTVYIDQGNIVAVLDASAPKPAGFESIVATETGGTLFPGLIELHNHLAYNILQLWDVPKAYGNRAEWQRAADYHNLVSGPMGILGAAPGLMPAIARYAECKCILGGVTTSQGIRLVSNNKAPIYFDGLVRNVERTGDPELPNAAALIADADTKDPKAFLAELQHKKCYLVHLSEGKDAKARQHFLSLEYQPGAWALWGSLAGIHCNALQKQDFDVLASRQASMVWSPLSNLLLYGETARVKEARASGVTVGIGSDWSPSGSKNLLGELKVAHLFSQNDGGFLSDRDIVAMATCNAARILKWESAIGSLEPGKRADLLVLAGAPADPYGAFVQAQETDLRLVMINGVPRYGEPSLMKALAAGGESLRVGGQPRKLFLKQATANPEVQKIPLSKARSLLTRALKDLPNHKKSALLRPPKAMLRAAPGTEQPTVWYLALDEIAETGMDFRPHLRFAGRPTMPATRAAAAKPPVLQSLTLDPLSVADDAHFLERIGKQRNLPDFVKTHLAELY